ncbi:hypothetical protein BJ165DRAFT_1494805 [Panaeolus papilionaceus]|nr:hypothetical protein BJ165DRAFT_1494805 [Panaeolus papilionaceus]
MVHYPASCPKFSLFCKSQDFEQGTPCLVFRLLFTCFRPSPITTFSVVKQRFMRF